MNYRQQINTSSFSNFENTSYSFFTHQCNFEENTNKVLTISFSLKSNKPTYSDYNDPFTGQLKMARADDLKQKLLIISQRCAALPDIDTRSPDEILGYNDFGLPE